MKKILLVDNSALMRRILCDIINADNDFHVIDMSHDGEDAYKKIQRTAYDLVVMEMNLPKMDGLSFVEKLYKENNPTKVILISTSMKADAEETLRALEYGSCDFVKRPADMTEQDKDFAGHLLRVMHNAIELMPERRSVAKMVDKPKNKVVEKPKKVVCKPSSLTGKPELVAIACSTGGPQALHTVMQMMPANVTVPIVVVQHMPAGFTEALANRIHQISKLNAKEAADGDVLKPGWIYIAPGGKHIEIAENHQGQHCIKLNKQPAINGLRPCADVMYHSLCKSSYQNILCVVMTGMGADGTKGITELRKKKKIYVISESEETCVVYGMPRSIEERGLSNESVPITKISDAIMKKLEG